MNLDKLRQKFNLNFCKIITERYGKLIRNQFQNLKRNFEVYSISGVLDVYILYCKKEGICIIEKRKSDNSTEYIMVKTDDELLDVINKEYKKQKQLFVKLGDHHLVSFYKDNKLFWNYELLKNNLELIETKRIGQQNSDLDEIIKEYMDHYAPDYLANETPKRINMFQSSFF